ncbi:MAG TPA: farnesyl diphosphate synthase, partial [Clostridia bacterium]
EDILPFACAVEMIHTYSLIHDDLPAMDNDDYRRGRLTNHKVYGEAIAILAGDALLNLAFETMINHIARKTSNILSGVKAMQVISDASGAAGMIGGQVVDLENEDKEISGDLLRYMHSRKTGALIKAPVMAAAIVCNANPEQMEYLKVFSEKIGLSFQIKDDILDIEGDFDTLGKSIGSDIANNKSTFVSLYGLNESKALLRSTTQEGINAIESFGEKAEFLKELAEYLINRSH